MEIQEKVFQLKMQGYCCSQIIMQLALDDMQEDNKVLIKAMKGLCSGLQIGSICGALSAATCLLFLLDTEKAQLNMNNELVEWFELNFGSLKCLDILGDNPMAKIEICPVIVEKTYEKILELMEDNNITFEEAKEDLK